MKRTISHHGIWPGSTTDFNVTGISLYPGWPLSNPYQIQVFLTEAFLNHQR